MAKSESQGAGDLGKQRPQVSSSVPAGKRAATAAESNRGDTAAGSSDGSTDLPPQFNTHPVEVSWVHVSSGGPPELPAQFGRYRVKKKLGGGGMGTVYLVENTELEREEALKVPHFADGDDPQVRERFLREAKSAAKLDHANLCPIFDAGVLDGVYYLTMRFLQGKLLTDFTSKAQPARKAVEIVTKLAQALEAAHGKGVIHRDLKPSNVMMVAGVGPVVMDFGLAKLVRQPDEKLTQAGAALGTPAYMPPEQVNGDLERMGPASDVYSLGVILYELLTGRLPFEGTMAAIFGQILYAEAPLPSALVPGLDPALDGICRKAMAKASTDRYPSMKAFAAALMDFLRQAPATAGAGNLVPAAVDRAAIFQAATVVPGLKPGSTAALGCSPLACTPMGYSAEISRTNPACFLFLIDQSGSMRDPIGGSTKKKADVVADAINRFLQTLVLRCAKSEGVRDYFYVGVIGYGKQVAPGLGGRLSGRDLVPISDVAKFPLRVEERIKKVDDGAGGLADQAIKFAVWFEPLAAGPTPMCKALDAAWQVLADFLLKSPACFPPLVINITDGEATDGDPEQHAIALRDMASQDGRVLLFNLHVSSSSGEATLLADCEADLTNDYARRLFRMSSVLPAPILATARRDGLSVTEATRGFCFNADLVSVVRFLDIGTRVDAKNLR